MIQLQQNDHGTWVREAQRLLGLAGFPIVNDGIFGAATTQVVKEFQQKKQLATDGKINDATWLALGWQNNTAEKRLKDEDFTAIAARLGVEVAAIRAVCEVESRGKGFLADGRPKILFEGHIFWSELKKRGKDPLQFATSNEDILFPKWNKDSYKGNELEYDRLSRAQSIDFDAALASASWGTFQIMGFNFKACGYQSIPLYVNSCYPSEGEHLKAFAGFITSARLVTHLKNKDWSAFANGYNGPAYKQNQYDAKLAAAYSKYATTG
jgi:hypothetical protein